MKPVPYRLIQDDSCHWYVIMVTQVDEFRRWNKMMVNWEEWNGHDFEQNRINGPHKLTFREWELE